MRRSATPDRRTPPAAGIALVAFLATAAAPALALAQSVPIPDYAQPAFIDSRLAVWIAAQLHLDFAAFVLAVPMFALAIEFFGWRMARRDPAGEPRPAAARGAGRRRRQDGGRKDDRPRLA